MPGLFRIILLLLGLAAAPALPITARGELAGWLALEGRYFLHAPLDTGQTGQSLSLALQPEYYHAWENGLAVTLTPFSRWDSGDEERSHCDIREFNLHYRAEAFDLTAGIGKVFWGTTEFVHLVDIINQTDQVESPDLEEKLGQPMLRLAAASRLADVELFILPWFRERTFPGEEGRLRGFPRIDPQGALYESPAEQSHADFALRLGRTIAAADLGLTWFRGTCREPLLLTGLSPDGQPVLVPYYQQISQTGFDLQMALGAWLWKAEGFYRKSDRDDFAAVTGGSEYTFYGVAGSGIDLGLLCEYAHDDRTLPHPPFYDRNLMAGVRLSGNDPAGTEALFGVMLDLGGRGRVTSLEISRRIGSCCRARLEGYFFSGQEDQDPLYPLREDDFVSLTLNVYL